MLIIKNLVIAILLGFLGYEATHIFLKDGFSVPATTPELSLLFIFTLVALIATFVGARPGSVRSSAGSASATAGSHADDRETGTVKWFNVRKGYGFITRDQGDDIFVHFRNIDGEGRRAINEGERVSFVVTDSDKGLQADEVRSA